MKKIIFIILLITSGQFVQSQQIKINGTNIRGLIKTHLVNNNSYVPIQAAVISLYHFDNNKHQWIIVAKTLTNQYGYYYFYRIKPGTYYIQVNGKSNYKINVIERSYQAYQFQDLPIIYN